LGIGPSFAGEPVLRTVSRGPDPVRPGIVASAFWGSLSDRAARQLERQAAPCARPGRPVLPALDFYEEDEQVMKPAQVLRLRPQPDMVVY
jgi:hypothetical protein